VTTPAPPMPMPATQLLRRRPRSACAVALLLALLAACGGGDAPADVSSTTAAGADVVDERRRALEASAGDGATPAQVNVLAAGLSPAKRPRLRDRPASRPEALRFMTQATFGPVSGDDALLDALGYRAWLDQQMALPASSHRAEWEAADAALKAVDPMAGAGQNQVFGSFWKQALTGPDQLRQRVAYALSQIFVVSAVDSNVGNEPRALADWLDMLGRHAFGNYRELLESVALHPQMGRYLSHLRNQKADPVSGRVPDQNFAREIMQLFSIGLVQLNRDGTPTLVNGRAVETYTGDDVAGLAKVFTGWSWACPAAPANGCFLYGSSGGVSDPDRAFKPMLPYPQYHATEAKSFLGVTIPAQATPDARASLKIALDTLAAHPNVGPFMSRQLIQRLVTSNPSPGYVADVAAVWANNGAGVRGDLRAVVRTILTHREARQPGASAGKLREPVLRLSAYLRAFPHSSDTGAWKIGNTDSPATSLGQTPLRAPSVFNFYRPGYVAPGSRSAAAGLVAPELQILNESSASGWVNTMRDHISGGVGAYNGTVGTVVFNRRDLQRNWSPELQLAANPADLAGSVIDKLSAGQSLPALQQEIASAVGSIVVPAPTATNATQVAAAQRNRVNAALLLTLASPEFLIQK
jgi:uncharacterized protein (DUF1800 family)